MLGDYESRLTIRMNEWFISGMCEACQVCARSHLPNCQLMLHHLA